MKRTITFLTSLFLLVSLTACGGNEASNTSDVLGTDLVDVSSTTEYTNESENNAGNTVSIPIPENVTITNSYDGLAEQWTEFSYKTNYQTVAEYIAQLESMGFTSNVEKWNDGIHHVTLTKDEALVTIEFVHDNRDDIFENMVANGDEINGTLRGRAYLKKTVNSN